MTSQRFRRIHQERAQRTNRAIQELAALGPEDEFWALLAATDPAGFLRAVAAHIRALRDQLPAAPNTVRDVPEPLINEPQPETHP